MTPHRPSSKKWTAFPAEFLSQIEAVFTESFAQASREARIIIEGRIYPEELMLRVGLLEKGRLKQANFEVSVDYKADQPEALERIHHLVDVAASMMLEYIESDGETEFPYLWKEITFKGQPVYVQYNTENSELEAQANALLGIDSDTLLIEEAISEDAFERAEKNHLH